MNLGAILIVSCCVAVVAAVVLMFASYGDQ